MWGLLLYVPSRTQLAGEVAPPVTQMRCLTCGWYHNTGVIVQWISMIMDQAKRIGAFRKILQVSEEDSGFRT